MRRTLITLLAVVTLLSQWGWVEHGYHDHDANEVCAACVSAAGHVAVPSSTLQLPVTYGCSFDAPPVSASFSSVAARYYHTRAPPSFL